MWDPSKAIVPPAERCPHKVYEPRGANHSHQAGRGLKDICLGVPVAHPPQQTYPNPAPRQLCSAHGSHMSPKYGPDSRVDLAIPPEFKFQLGHFIAVRYWANYFTSLCSASSCVMWAQQYSPFMG